MTTFAQRSFSGGEIDPSLWARCDTVKYATGTRTLRNFFVPRHGGAQSRAATSFVAQSEGSGRLIPFVFNPSQTYVLEFSGQKIRFYRNGIQLTDSTATITGITNANPMVITTSAAHGFGIGDEIQFSGIVGPIGDYLNNRTLVISSVTATTFNVRYMGPGATVDSTTFGAYTSGGSAARAYTISSPYLDSDILLVKFVQSADVMTMVHPSYNPQELKRLADTNWTITPISFSPQLAAPTGLTASGTPPGGGISVQYLVTAVTSGGDESLPQTASVGWINASVPTQSAPGNISWTAVSGAYSYIVYRSTGGGAFGFLASTLGTSYSDIGAAADAGDTPPVDSNQLSVVDNRPGAVGYYQQRLAYSSSNTNPETSWLSRTGRFKNLSISFPTKDDDSITFRLVGRQVNQIKHLVDIGKLIILTAGGEWAINGDAAGSLVPTAINAKQYSYNGASDVRPIVIDNSLLYVQARGSLVRDLAYDFQVDGYKGNDLTIFSSHLVKGHTIKDWTYCQTPDSIVWAVRDDGVLIGLTYIREQQILAWHRHDLNGGTIISVCSVPEGSEDILYMIVQRVIKGVTVRYIERMSSRFYTNVVEFNGLDASLIYDGRKPSSSTLTLSGGVTWDQNDTLTATASAAVFKSTDVGNSCFVESYDANGIRTDIVRCTITAYTSATVVSVTPNKTVPVSMRTVAISTWSHAVVTVGGLWHLEGLTVGVYADGFVVGNPNNADYTNTYTVTNGKITLDRAYAYIRAGIPMICDVQTLDIDTPQGTSLSDKKISVSKVTCFVQDSRSFWVGPQAPDDDSVDPLQYLTELKIRQSESMDDPVSLVTDKVEVNIMPEWNSNGRVFIRHIDPVPLTILEIAPAGLVPIGRG